MRRPAALLLGLLALGAATLAPLPAAATPQPLFGTTVDVIVQWSGQTLLGQTARMASTGGMLVARVEEPRATNIAVTFFLDSAPLGACTIVAPLGTNCATGTGALAAGEYTVDVAFSDGVDTVTYQGTLLAVDVAAPEIALEWRDAVGNWIDGTGGDVPLRGETTARCVITNVSNASFVFDAFEATITHATLGAVTPITGTLEAGQSRAVEVWSGPVSGLTSASCGGSVSYATSMTASGSRSGTVIPVTGTFALSATTAAPGDTVVLTASGIGPAIAATYPVRLDGAPVAGSPFAVTVPDPNFRADVALPADAALGAHLVTLAVTYNGITSVVAALPITVALPELAATGTDPVALARAAGLGLLMLLGGALLLASARRRRRQAASASASRIV
jgi:hypothetical protein